MDFARALGEPQLYIAHSIRREFERHGTKGLNGSLFGGHLRSFDGASR
jgi:hypothetical protein